MKIKVIYLLIVLTSIFSLNSCVIYDTLEYQPISRTQTIHVPTYNVHRVYYSPSHRTYYRPQPKYYRPRQVRHRRR